MSSAYCSRFDRWADWEMAYLYWSACKMVSTRVLMTVFKSDEQRAAIGQCAAENSNAAAIFQIA